jgi:hypothetical protein
MEYTDFSYRGENYKQYFKTPHWARLLDQLIYSNPDAHCWIDQKKSSLLPHHERYDNLFHEKEGRDIFVLCFDCHTQLHFPVKTRLFTKKIPLLRWNLKRRRLFLKLMNCIERRDVFPSIWYFLRYLFVL